MRAVLLVLLLPLICEAVLLGDKPHLAAKADSKHVQLSASERRLIHWGCSGACPLLEQGSHGSVSSSCVTKCEQAMYQCIDTHTMSAKGEEIDKDTAKCQDDVMEK